MIKFFSLVCFLLAVTASAPSRSQDFHFLPKIFTDLRDLENLANWRDQLSRYLTSTEQGLEQMRNPDTFLINDITEWSPLFSEESSKTSPTNLGLDLILQLEKGNEALIGNILSSLAGLEYHPKTGLFFGWYSTVTGAVRSKNLSSVDNIHLALALWSISQKSNDPLNREKAQRLFGRMNFTVFIDKGSSPWKIIGNYQHMPAPPEGGIEHWVADDYRFDYLGSESRSIAALIPALHLAGKDENLSGATFSNSMRAEFHSGTLKTWDGGLFQLYLPNLLLDEKTLSPKLRKAFTKTADSILVRRHVVGNHRIPYAHSASGTLRNEKLDYEGAFGNWDMMAEEHKARTSRTQSDFEAVFAPYAYFLANEFRPQTVAALMGMENMGSSSMPFYDESRGWLDGVHVDIQRAGRVVPGQYSLDQLITALSIRKALSPQQRLKVNESLHSGDTFTKIQSYYEGLEAMLPSDNSAIESGSQETDPSKSTGI